MGVPTRNTILAGAGSLALLLIGSSAVAGAGMGGGAPVIPGAGSGGSGSPCCGKAPPGHSLIVPGVNVAGPNVMVSGSNVTVNQGHVVTHTSSYLSTSIVASGESGYYVSGGGGYYAPQGVAASSINALNVEGGEERYLETVIEDVPTTEEYCAESVSMQQALRAVQAVCIDDKGAPHPASQVSDLERIAPGYKGEVFRCMAGTRMQVTLGPVEDGATSFAHGDTFACQKGEALVHRPGGELACAPQMPERTCNERSLLRRYGPGVKLVEARITARTCMPQTRTVMRRVEREVERTRATKAQPMVFDGGVGQGVY